MITRLSRAADWRRSYSCALGPPTSTSSPPARLATARRPGTRSSVVVAYGSPCSTTVSRAPGGPCCGGETWLTISRWSFSAAATAGAFDASGTITSVGAEDPAGKLRETTFWPSTDSTSPRKELPLVSPVSRLTRLAASTSRTTVPVTQTARGRAVDAVADAAPGAVRLVDAGLADVRDRAGQNQLRPQIVSSAGSIVSIEIIAIPTPIAPIGPRPAVPLTSAIESVSSAAITVRPEAKIAGPGAAQRDRASPRACPRGGAAPRGSARRAAARSRSRRRTRARGGCRRTGR